MTVNIPVDFHIIEITTTVKVSIDVSPTIATIKFPVTVVSITPTSMVIIGVRGDY